MILRLFLIILLFSIATTANAMIWSIEERIVRLESEGIVSQYTAGFTDTFGAYEDFLLLDCNDNLFQSYMIIHSDIIDGSTETNLRADVEIDLYMKIIERFRVSGGKITFEALEMLSKEIGAIAKFIPLEFVDTQWLRQRCAVMDLHNIGSGDWKIK